MAFGGFVPVGGELVRYRRCRTSGITTIPVIPEPSSGDAQSVSGQGKQYGSHIL